MDLSLLWIPATIAAAAAQTARNATQRQLTETIGTVGATQVRFLYGLPFALVFLALVLRAPVRAYPGPTRRFLISRGRRRRGADPGHRASCWRRCGSASFAVVWRTPRPSPSRWRYSALAAPRRPLTPSRALAIVIATAGVVLMSLEPGDALVRPGLRPARPRHCGGCLFRARGRRLPRRHPVTAERIVPDPRDDDARVVPRHPDGDPRRAGSASSTARPSRPACAPGGRRSAPASSGRWRRNSGSSASRSRAPQTCARSRSSRSDGADRVAALLRPDRVTARDRRHGPHRQSGSRFLLARSH